MENKTVSQNINLWQELSPNGDHINLHQFIQSEEREIVLKELKNNLWNGTKTAKALGITYRALRYCVAKLGLISRLQGGKLRPYPAKPSSVYNTKFRAIRYSILLRDNSTCQLCGANPKTGASMHVDHIKPRSKYPELELDPDNLRVLCQECNLTKSDRTDHL